MKENDLPTTNPPKIYQIILSEPLDPSRAFWFEGLEIQVKDGKTTLTGELMDQAALFGVLERIRDLGINLCEVRCFDRRQKE